MTQHNGQGLWQTRALACHISKNSSFSRYKKGSGSVLLSVRQENIIWLRWVSAVAMRIWRLRK